MDLLEKMKKVKGECVRGIEVSKGYDIPKELLFALSLSASSLWDRCKHSSLPASHLPTYCHAPYHNGHEL